MIAKKESFTPKIINKTNFQTGRLNLCWNLHVESDNRNPNERRVIELLKGEIEYFIWIAQIL